VLVNPKPWEDPVDGTAILHEVSETTNQFVFLPDGAPDAIALWTVHTHVHDSADHSPILAVISPEKGSGKTTFFSILRTVVPRYVSGVNFTTASLFRMIEEYHPTLLIDEADTIFRDDEPLRRLLNSGHEQTSALVVRCDGDSLEPRQYSTWAPKAMALIGKLPSTIADRSIVIPMRRQPREQRRERLPKKKIIEMMEPTLRKAARWGKDNQKALRDADPDLPEQLSDREQDNWRPLIAIADLAGGEWPERARKAALLLHGQVDEADTSYGVQLLVDIKAIFLQRGENALPSKDIVEVLSEMEDRKWPEWRHEKPITERQLAAILKPFGIKPKPMRFGQRAGTRGYRLEWFKDTFASYLPADPQQAQQSSNDGGFEGSSIRNKPNHVADAESASNPHEQRVVADVADKSGGSGSQDGKPPVEDPNSPISRPLSWEGDINAVIFQTDPESGNIDTTDPANWPQPVWATYWEHYNVQIGRGEPETEAHLYGIAMLLKNYDKGGN